MKEEKNKIPDVSTLAISNDIRKYKLSLVSEDLYNVCGPVMSQYIKCCVLVRCRVNIIECQDGTELITGLLDFLGHADEQNAYRSKLAGVYGIDLILSLISNVCTKVKGHVIVVCDCKGALHKAFDRLNNVFARAPHVYILSGIHFMQ